MSMSSLMFESYLLHVDKCEAMCQMTITSVNHEWLIVILRVTAVKLRMSPVPHHSQLKKLNYKLYWPMNLASVTEEFDWVTIEKQMNLVDMSSYQSYKCIYQNELCSIFHYLEDWKLVKWKYVSDGNCKTIQQQSWIIKGLISTLVTLLNYL
jgi:hypothetical protein